MRKKSHISLAIYIADSLNSIELKRHRKAFFIGSILPDCKPSFFTTKHEYLGTISMVENKIKQLTSAYNPLQYNERSYVIDLGQVLHYVADYFTFPHNVTYGGNLKDHCKYEKELKFGLRSYIKSGDALKAHSELKNFTSCEALFKFIEKAHQEYLSLKRNVQEDCMYIVSVCRQVAEAILNLLSLQKEKTFGLVYAH